MGETVDVPYRLKSTLVWYELDHKFFPNGKTAWDSLPVTNHNIENSIKGTHIKVFPVISVFHTLNISNHS